MNPLLPFEWSISETVVERLGWVLLHSLWQFAVVALFAGAIVRALRRNSALARYNVLVAALAVAVAVPVATWMLLPGNAQIDKASRVASAPGFSTDASTNRRGPILLESVPATPLASHLKLANHTYAPAPTPDVGASSVAPDTFPAVSPPATPNIPLEPTWSQAANEVLRPWLAWIVVGWSLGVVVCSLRPLLGWQTLRRLRRVGVSPVSDDVLAVLRRVSARLGLRRTVRVLQSTLAQVPVVVGYLRPVILLPVSLMTTIPAAQLEAILAHELAHVRRHDFVVNLLQTLIETLFFYHPAVWRLSRQIRVEREHCCDDLVVALLGNRVEYGRALVAIEQMRGQHTIFALGAADGSLLSRVRRIAGLDSNRAAVRLSDHWPVALVSLACLGVAIVLSMNWSLAAKDDDEHDWQPAIARLPGDLTVELIGVGFHPSKDRDWWKPDGSSLDQRPVLGGRFSVMPDSPEQVHCREFLIHIRGLPPEHSVLTDYGGVSSATGSSYAEGLWVGEHGAGPFKSRTTTIRLGLTTEPYGPTVSIDVAGRKQGVANMPVDLKPFYDRVAPIRVEESAGQTELLLEDSAYNELHKLAAWELRAIDTEGQKHRSSSESVPASREGRIPLRHIGFKLPRARIARFEYRLRPCRHWVTFENVSLQPGQKTKVKVKNESLAEDPDAALLPGGANANSGVATATVPDAEKHQSATYLQKQVVAKIPDAAWGEPRNGLRLAMVVRDANNTQWNDLPAETPIPLSLKVQPGDEVRCQLVVENVSDHSIDLSAYSYSEVGRTIEVLDRNGDKADVQSIRLSSPVFPTHWRLQPGERFLLQMPPIHFVDKEPNQGIGYFVTTAPGDCTLHCSYTFGDHNAEASRPATNTTEWTGTLTTAVLNVMVADSPPSDEPDAANGGLRQEEPRPIGVKEPIVGEVVDAVTRLVPRKDAKRALDQMLEASRSARQGLSSAIGTGTFERWEQRLGEKEPMQMTKGRIQAYYDSGKYHLRLTHEKLLWHIRDLPNGVHASRRPGEHDVFRNEEDEVIEVPERIADGKPERAVIVHDGKTIESFEKSARIRPLGYKFRDWNKLYTAGVTFGLGVIDPVLLGPAYFDIERLNANIGAGSIEISRLPNRGFRAAYRFKDAPKLRVEFDVVPEAGFNVVAERAYNDELDPPAQVVEATWKRVEGQWVVTRLSFELGVRGKQNYHKDVIEYESFQVNPWVDPAAFTRASMIDDDWKPRTAADGDEPLMPREGVEAREKAQADPTHQRDVKTGKDSATGDSPLKGNAPPNGIAPGEEPPDTTEIVRPLLPSIVLVIKINPKTGRPEPNPNWRAGVVVDERGYILTTLTHDDLGRDSIAVRLANQSEYPAELVASDPKLELAVLRIRTSRPLTAISLSKAQVSKNGEAVIAVPSPAQKVATSGVVMAVGRYTEPFPVNLIESDLPLPLGEAGSLMVTDKGEPAGIWFAISAGTSRTSFAVPLQDVLPLLAKAVPQRAGDKPEAKPAESKSDGPATSISPAIPVANALPKGLEFLTSYPRLHGLFLDMTEKQFLAIAEKQELKPRKTSDGGSTQYRIPTGDGHTVIVMFRHDNSKCTGIQRIRGEEPAQPANGEPKSDKAATDKPVRQNARAPAATAPPDVVSDGCRQPESDDEKAVAKRELVFFQDKSRRTLPGLMIGAAGETFVLTVGPATVVPDGALKSSTEASIFEIKLQDQLAEKQKTETRFFNSGNGKKIETKIATKWLGRGIMEMGRFETYPTNRQVAPSFGERATPRCSLAIS